MKNKKIFIFCVIVLSILVGVDVFAQNKKPSEKAEDSSTEKFYDDGHLVETNVSKDMFVAIPVGFLDKISEEDARLLWAKFISQ